MLSTNASPASNDIFKENGKVLITKKLIFLQTEFVRPCLKLTIHKVKISYLYHFSNEFEKLFS